MEAHYAEQGERLDKIKALYAKYQALPEDRRTCVAVTTFIHRLETYHEDFKRKHELILKNKKMNLTDEYFTLKVSDFEEDAYWDTRMRFDEIAKTYAMPEEANTSHSSGVSQNNSHAYVPFQSSLAPISIEPFTGKQANWDDFRDLYRSVIHHDERIPNATKFYYLKSLLKGKALEVIKEYPLTGANYMTAWEALTLYYENKRRLTHRYLRDMFNSKPIKNLTATSLSSLLREVTIPVDSLRKMGRTDTEIVNDIMVYLISQNLDPVTQLDWLKSLGSQTDPATFEALRIFINERVASLESSEFSSKTNSSGDAAPSKAKPKPQVSHMNERGARDKPLECPCCGQEHLIRHCPAFKAKGIQERVDIIFKARLCTNCFGPHFAKECTSQYRCFQCQGRHNTLLHRTNQDSRGLPNRQSSNDLPTPETEQKSSKPMTSFGPNDRKPSQHAKPKFDGSPNQKPFPPGNLGKSSGNSFIAQKPVIQGKSFMEFLSKDCEKTNDSPNVQSHNTSSSTNTFSSNSALSKGGVLLATAIVRVQGSAGIEVLARALIDPCSQVSVMSESLCQRLRIKPRRTNMPVTGTGGVLLANVRKIAEVTVKPRFNSNFSLQVESCVMSQVTSYEPPTMNGVYELAHLKGLCLADPRFMDKSHVDLLLNAVVYSEILESGVIKGPPNQPIAIKSSLGWLVSGKIFDGVNESSSLTSLHVCNDCNLDQSLQKFWKQEEVFPESLLTVDEVQFSDHFNTTTYRDQEGRYVLSLPFKDFKVDYDKVLPYENNLMVPFHSFITEKPDLRSSFYAAEKMLFRMENRFKNDAKLKDMYLDFMKEYEDTGHMSKIVPNSSKNCYFIPHHAVLKEKSTSTKLRTVFNASAKVKSGISLNDLLNIGPNLLPSLADLLLRWQNYRYVFVADIQKMYRQMLICPEDRQFQCILWRKSPDEPISVYELNTVTYGVSSSPCQANMTIKKLAKDHLTEHPWGSAVLRDEIYMDDVLSGGYSLQEAVLKQIDCTQLLERACFPLRKYLSNHPEILANVPQEFLEGEAKAFKDEFAILGVSWHPATDEFSFAAPRFEEAAKLTRRVVLSRAAKLFDPLGWISPVIIQAKIIMQLLWQEKRGWDDEISQQNARLWQKWESQLRQLEEITIPRWSNFSPTAEIIELHGFADASKVAYGGVLYLRIVQNDQTVVSLLTAKSKVAPLSLLSIPRLELCAANLLAELANRYLKITKVAITSCHLWSDSTDVLQWLKSHPSKWKVFVAHRCAKIHEAMPDAHWHHVRSKDNPADILSRGCSPAELKSNRLWWNGPAWLSETTTPWTSTHEAPVEMKEPPPEETVSKKIVTHVMIDATYPLEVIHRISSYPKLVRVIAYCLRFIEKLLIRVVILRQASCQDENPVHLFNLTLWSCQSSNSLLLIRPAEMLRSRDFLIYLHQRIHFSALKLELCNKKSCHKLKNLLKLNPFMDGDLIRVGGRLANAQLPHENKYPLLLHRDDVISKLIVRQTHLDTLHGGVNLTLGTVRLQFWILKGRDIVKACISRCHTCKLYSKQVCTQFMGSLPEQRTKPTPAFAVSGIDYAGPVKVRLSKTRGGTTQKGYIAVFVCFLTHAVHLEIVEDYTPEAFIAAFTRFISTRGHCTDLYSDQGTTFVGADSELKSMFQGAMNWSQEVQIQLSGIGTEWHFIPPGAPHFGGLWESAVKSMKHHLYRMVGEHPLTFIEYTTLLKRIESILNSRPLLPLTDDISDLEPLTPAHLINNRSSYFIPEPNYRGDKIPLSKRYELISQISQHFWDRWSNEYLTSLHPRTKWLKQRRCLQVGDLVRIKNETTSPGTWPLGVIVKTHPGKDNLVHAATVRTAYSEYRRPIVKLVLLERVENLNS